MQNDREPGGNTGNGAGPVAEGVLGAGGVFHESVYIAGSGGMLGAAVYPEFVDSGHRVMATDIDQNESWLGYADVRDLASMERSIASFQPDLLINLAALTDLEFCERNVENSWATNALGAENMAVIARRLGIPLIQISTAGIVDGEQDIYNDFDEVRPLSIYAKSKYYGELCAQQMVPNHFVFRAGWMMGGGPAKDKKFVNKIYQQIAAGARVLHVVDDKLGTPTFTRSFAQGLRLVSATDLYGVYNQVCEGECSRFDVAVEFVRLLGLADHVEVIKVDSDHFAQEYFAPRPASEKLVNMKLKARGFHHMPHWSDALACYAEVFSAELAKQRLAA